MVDDSQDIILNRAQFSLWLHASHARTTPFQSFTLTYIGFPINYFSLILNDSHATLLICVV